MNYNPRNIPFIKLLFSTLLVAFIYSNVQAQNAKQGLTPLQVSKIKHVDDAIISPDGSTIAYTVTHPANPLHENKPATSHLYVRGINDSTGTPYITSMDVSNIAFRPQHQAITFLSKINEDEEIALYQISLKGGGPQKIYSFKRSIADYNWAPDGNHLAFMAADEPPLRETALPYQPEIYEENVPQRRGYVTNVAEQMPQPHQLAMEGSIYTMKWAPDGESLAIAIAPTPFVDDYYMHQQVLITDHRGQDTLAQIEHEGKLGQLEWSPDGNNLALIAGANIHDPVAGRLFVVPDTGGEPTLLSPDFEGMFEQVHWADSTTINYLASKGVWSSFGSINMDGTNMRTRIAPGETVLQQFSMAQNGSIAFMGEKSTHPLELFAMQPGDTKPRRLTTTNPWLANIAMGTQKVVTWQAEDSLNLQGLLIYPLDYVEGERYPMITVVHGGPESHYDNGWLTGYSDPGQVAAANGYFVFYPNYRGSTGRGLEFAMSSQGDMAGAEFDDIMQGVDDLIAESIADSARIGVTGGSYGGYATGWFSTRYTNRFAAGVMFVGISDNISKWGSSDIPEELFLVHARKRIWNDYMGFLERSPIYYAGQADTPLLILAGKEDTRVDPGQSFELYRHIKTRTDTPVRLVLYHGEGHGNRNATARYDYNLRMMRWFNRYLKGEQEQRPDAELEVENVDMGN